MAPTEKIALRTKTERLARLQSLMPLLACPQCGGSLAMRGDELISDSCGSRYPVRDGIPILLPSEMVDQGLGGELGFDEDASMHPYSPASADIIRDHAHGWVLDLGAGGKHIEHSNVVQIDVFRFPMTDVVASADCLPFRSNVFDAVVSQAVFEHLQYPEAAASEVWRVLKPDGVAKIDTAFLQPEHAYPHHYFNATEAGLKHWFRDFELEWSGVEPYQHPKWALAWFLAVYFAGLPDASRQVIEKLSLGECLDLLSRLSRNKLTAKDAAAVQALDALTVTKIRTLAAGVSVRAIKRGGMEQISRRAGSASDASPALQLGLERRVEQLVRNDVARRDRDLAVSEIQQVAADRARYLLQFYVAQQRDPWDSPGYLKVVRGLTVREIKRWVPQFLWQKLRAAYRCLFADAQRDVPVLHEPRADADLTFVVHPKSVVSLLDMFFSLTHQSHGGWALWVCESPDLSMEIRRLARELAALDSRVQVIPAGNQMRAQRLKHWVYLPHNCVLSFCAVFELVTLALSPANYRRITADVERWADASQSEPPMRCHGWQPAELLAWQPPLIKDEGMGLWCAEPMVVQAGLAVLEGEPTSAQAGGYAHIPKLLFRLVEFSAV